MVLTRNENKKFCLSKRPHPPKFEHFCVLISPEVQDNAHFQTQIVVHIHTYFMVCNVLRSVTDDTHEHRQYVVDISGNN